MYRLKDNGKAKRQDDKQVGGHQQWMKHHGDNFRCLCHRIWYMEL